MIVKYYFPNFFYAFKQKSTRKARRFLTLRVFFISLPRQVRALRLPLPTYCVAP